MSNVFFHTALMVLDDELKDKHITTMFSKFTGKGKIRTSSKDGLAIVTDIVYWKEARCNCCLG